MKQVAVIGAGTMGAGIAAQLANNNCKVLLLDLKKDSKLIASDALDRLLNSSPPAFVHTSKAQLVVPLDIEQELDLVSNCDLVIEAIIEDLSVKHDFYLKVAEYLSPNTILASNTSTFQLKQLKKGIPQELAAKIVICHFFNPPRYMQLLELVTDGEIDAEKKERLTSFLTNTIGKVVIDCKDTPGFIANRIGCFLLEASFKYAAEYQIDVTTVDYIFSRYLGFPSTGIFGLYDLIGLDVMQLISKSLVCSLPNNDLYSRTFQPSFRLEHLIDQGYNGRKGKGGFYRITRNNKGEKVKEVLNLNSLQYELAKPIALPYQTFNELIASCSKLDQDQLAKFATKVMVEFCWYVLTIASEISFDTSSIDKAMQLGYSWKNGPFVLMDKVLGFDWLVRQFQVNELPIPEFIQQNLQVTIDAQAYSVQPHSLERIVKAKGTLVTYNGGAKLWQLKVDKLCFEIITKNSLLNEEVFTLLDKAIEIAEKQNSTLIIYSDQKYFCAGGDLKIFLEQAHHKNFLATKQLINLGQQVFHKLKYAKVPVVSCARGFALGGGCELLLHSQYVVAHQDLVAGLVEVKLGLIPGWGGLKEMIVKANNIRELKENIDLILLQFKSQSALDFAEHFKHTRVIAVASNLALLEYALNYDFEQVLIEERKALNFDIQDLSLSSERNSTELNLIAKLIESKIKESGNNIHDEQLLKLEKEIFLELMAKESTIENIKRVI